MGKHRNTESAAQVVKSDEFLTPEESEAFLKGIAQPTPGTYLDMFIWEFANGSVKRFAAKIGYHPNRISTLKSSTAPISAPPLSLHSRSVQAWQKRT